MPFANSGSAFVGRAHERHQLGGALADASKHGGRVILLSGEPGVGKTRLAQELADQASAEGARVLWARGSEAGTAIPYWPWIQLLRGAIQAESTGTARLQANPELDRLVALLPEIQPSASYAASRSARTLRISQTALAPEASGNARFRLFGSVADFLKQLSKTALLVVVIDDLHAADPDSLMLLGFVASELRQSKILVVATHREVEVRLSTESDAMLDEIGRGGTVVRLTGLSKEETAELARQTIGRAVDEVQASSLHRATGGNPFLLNETIQLMREESSGLGGGIESYKFVVPEGVRALLRRRLARISDTTRRVLEVASVMTGDCDLALIARVSELAEATVAESMREAATHGLMTKVPGRPERCRFNHGLTAECLIADMSHARLAQLHKTIGEAIEELHGGDFDQQLENLAFHFSRALPLGTASKAVDYTVRAADYALSRMAYGDAAKLYKLALDILAKGPGSDPKERCELLVALGGAEIRAGSREEARLIFQQAGELARMLGDRDLLAQSALECGVWPHIIGKARRGSVELVDDALNAIGDSNLTLRAMLLARRAVETNWLEQRERVIALATEAVGVARRSGDAGALVVALWTRHAVLWGPDSLEQRLAAATEMMALAESAGDWDWLANARELRAASLLEAGEVAAIDAEIDASTSVAEKTGYSWGIVERLGAMRALLRGDLGCAEKQIQQVLSIGQRRRDQTLLITYTGQFAQLRWEQGRAEELEGLLRGPYQEIPLFSAARIGVAIFYARAGRLSEAAVELEFLAKDQFASIVRDHNWLGIVAQISEVCSILGDTARAAKLYELLSPYVGRSVTLGWGDLYLGPVTHYLGLLATTRKQLDRAQAHFEAAIRFNLRMGAKPCLARTQAAYAEMLLLRGEVGDHDKAIELTEAALVAARAIEMNGLVEKAEALKQRASAPVPLRRKHAVESAVAPQAIFRQEGDFWTIGFGGQVTSIKDVKGMAYVAILLRHPGQEVHAVDIAGAGDTGDCNGAGRISAMSDRQRNELGLSVGGLGDAGQMLDPEAKAQYRARINQLREEMEDAKELGKEERVAEIEEEMEAICSELARAVGLHGRDRRAASISDRVRVNVTRAIKRAIGRIADKNPPLGRMLTSAIKTGTFCCYLHDPAQPINWEF
jgi:tetratricopeptide (TPR) repeat protein